MSIESIKISALLDHDNSLAVYMAAGHPYPKIPDGKNTCIYHFVTNEGHPAVLINQTGFARELEDNEEQVNGCSLLIATEDPDNTKTREALENAVNILLERP